MNGYHIRDFKANTICISCDANLASCRYNLDSSYYSPTQPIPSSFILLLLHRGLLECYGPLVNCGRKSNTKQKPTGLECVTDYAALPALLHKALVLHIGLIYHPPRVTVANVIISVLDSLSLASACCSGCTRQQLQPVQVWTTVLAFHSRMDRLQSHSRR